MQVLFEGPMCRRQRTLKSKWCLTPMRNWGKYGYKPKLNFTSCAVVGNSDTLLNRRKPRGRLINEHSVVIRFNMAPTRKYEKFAGAWSDSTIRVQNKERGGFAERQGEFCVVWRNNNYVKKHSDKKCKVRKMTPQFEKYAATYWAMHNMRGRPYRRGQQAKLSNGFLGMVIALHNCASVSLFGFSQGSGHYYKKFTGKPKGFGDPTSKIELNKRRHSGRHSWVAERACMAKLSRELDEVRIYK